MVLALLFWNPVSYYLIYHNTPIYSIKVIHIFYWVIFLSGLIVILMIQKNKINERLKNVALTLAFTGILFSALVIINLLVGFTINKNNTKAQNQEGLIFEPNSKARYKTVEFDFVADINRLGLRDREISIEKDGKFRILCIGDSWTYGWGVNIENSWPRKLEKYLQTSGFENVEVINCGQVGQYTSTYKDYVKKIVPVLKPDLVLVGVLQLDDLAQLYENNFQPITKSTNKKFLSLGKIKFVVKEYLKYSFNNILLLLGKNESKIVEIRSVWKTSSTSVINNFDHSEKIRFSTLGDSVQKLFISGDLNPGLLTYYISYSDRTAIFNNPNHPATIFSIKEMNKDFKVMKDICKRHNSALIFINMPSNTFTGHVVNRTSSDVLNAYFEKNNKIDSIYRSIAVDNGLPYIGLTDYFIGLQNKTDYFFKFDGHPKENGYDEIAKFIGKQLIDQNKLRKE